MTMADNGTHKLNVVGPTGISHLLASMRSYSRRYVLFHHRSNCIRDALLLVPSEIDHTGTDIACPPELPSALSNKSGKNATKKSKMWEQRQAAGKSVSWDLPPIYTDSNITVWAASIAPEPAPSEAEEASGKRKRSPSPATSSKRSGGSEERQSTSTRHMHGQVANNHRQNLIRATFPGVQREWSADKGPRTPGWGTILPPHERSLGDKNTLAYVLQGPRIRGKFDVDESLRLGVPKSMRSRLTMGEAVTFDVKGPDGEKETRTVNADQVMGKSESPSVRICSVNLSDT